jgi:DNA-binding NarL/FixJ family response regulator
VAANSRNASLVSDPGELKERIATILVEAGLGVEAAERPRLDALDEGVSGPVVGAGSTGTRSAAIRTLRRRNRDVPLVVVVPSDGSRQGCRSAISAGADGAVLEKDIEAALPAAVEAAEGGQVVFPRSVLRAATAPPFSRREKQVLGMMVLGSTNHEIATQLGLAESTIKSHLSSAFEKLGVSSRSEAAALILDTASGLGLEVLAIEGESGRES